MYVVKRVREWDCVECGEPISLAEAFRQYRFWQNATWSGRAKGFIIARVDGNEHILEDAEC